MLPLREVMFRNNICYLKIFVLSSGNTIEHRWKLTCMKTLKQKLNYHREHDIRAGIVYATQHYAITAQWLIAQRRKVKIILEAVYILRGLLNRTHSKWLTIYISPLRR